MTRRFDYYYLQRNAGSAWDTVEEAESVAVLSGGLADQLVAPGDAEIRIVGAAFDHHSGAWSYEQLFYIDQSSIDLGIGDQPVEDDAYSDPLQPAQGAALDDWDDVPDGSQAALPEPDPDPVPEAEPEVEPEFEPEAEEEPDSERRAGPAVAALLDGIGKDKEDDDDPSDDAPPWSRLDNRDDEDEDEFVLSSARSDAEDDPFPPSAFEFKEPPPRKRFSFGKFFLILILLLLLIAGGGLGAMWYLQHPMLLNTADKLGVGKYVRMGRGGSAMNESSGGASMAAQAPAAEQVQPLTTGQVVRYSGIAPHLRGRWSPRKCDTTFIEFTEDGYSRTVDGQASAEATSISETLEDDFQFYLRQSPGMVEHFKKVTANDIQLAGVTTKSGFLAGGGKVEIYSRCP